MKYNRHTVCCEAGNEDLRFAICKACMRWTSCWWCMGQNQTQHALQWQQVRPKNVGQCLSREVPDKWQLVGESSVAVTGTISNNNPWTRHWVLVSIHPTSELAHKREKKIVQAWFLKVSPTWTISHLFYIWACLDVFGRVLSQGRCPGVLRLSCNGILEVP